MYAGIVRTTIDLKPEHRARLLEIAARRGEKGFSLVVAEAIDCFLRQDLMLRERRKKALSLRASITPPEAGRLHGTTARIREFWR
jgi:hypothetical protein